MTERILLIHPHLSLTLFDQGGFFPKIWNFSKLKFYSYKSKTHTDAASENLYSILIDIVIKKCLKINNKMTRCRCPELLQDSVTSLENHGRMASFKLKILEMTSLLRATSLI